MTSSSSATPSLNVALETDNSITNPNFGKNLIVNYLSHDIREHTLRERFKKYGHISHVKIPRNDNQDSLSYGFVLFADIESAQNAMANENGTSWYGKKIRVSIARDKDKDQYCKIIISNIPSHVTQDNLTAIFGQFGRIIEIRVVNSGQRCFIEFDTINECNHAILAMNRVFLEGSTSPISVQFAERDHYERKSENQITQSQTIHEFPTARTTPLMGISDRGAFPKYHYDYPPISCLEYSIPHHYINTFTASTILLPSYSVEYVLEVSGFSPAVSATQLCSAFSPYGQIIGFRLHTISIDPLCRYTATSATIHIFGSIQLRDTLLQHLNGTQLFPCEGPIFLSIH